MFRSLGEARRQYPHQFWFLFWGMLINAAGTSMIWPFLTIFLRQQLALPRGDRGAGQQHCGQAGSDSEIHMSLQGC